MGRKSKKQRESEIFTEALSDFNDIQSAQRDERQQCMNDRRFGSIAGAQWEGKLGEQFENKPKLEVNKIQLSVIRIYNEYRNNRITVDFEPADGSKNDALADTCNDLYRATERLSVAEEAYDNAFDEGSMGGIGAWRLRTEYEDEFDEANEYQRIVIDPIFDADVTVYFDLGAKRQDKSDARYAFLLTSMTKKAFEEEWNQDPTTWPQDINEGEFDWSPEDLVYVAEYYRVEDVSDTIYTYETLLGEEITIRKSEIEEPEDDELSIVDEVEAKGAVLVDTRRVKSRKIRKYIMSGSGILEDCGYIAGKNIPIVPFYGKRWYVDGIERAMGHVRLPKDMQRLQNMQVSKLAEISAFSSVEKPIFTPDQIAGHQLQWRDDNIEDYPYLLLNPTVDKDGNEAPAGAIGYTRSPQIPPAMAQLIPFTDQSMKDLLGNPEAGEQIASNVSGDAIELVQQALGMQTFIYMSNMAKAIKRSGEIWLSMAKDVFVEDGRTVKGITKQNTPRQIELNRKVMDKDSGAVTLENDLSSAKMDLAVDVGPTSNTKRQATVKALSVLLRMTPPEDAETRQVITSMIMMNMDGEGIGDIREFFRERLVRMGIVEPTEEEAAKLAQEAQNQPPTAQDDFLRKSAEKEAALGEKYKADTVQSLAKAQNLEADTAKKQAETTNIDAEESGESLAKRAMEVVNDKSRVR